MNKKVLITAAIITVVAGIGIYLWYRKTRKPAPEHEDLAGETNPHVELK